MTDRLAVQLRQGVDIVSVERIKEMIRRQSHAFTRRVFTAKERAYCEPKRAKEQHYAARFAAKEAFIKAAQLPGRVKFSLKDIEVRNRSTGKPYIYLTRRAEKLFGLPKQYRTELSLSHERDHAVATVLLIFP
ncbi:MAG: holo-ACP synthase [Candidatus Omnitrophota bacterium]|nr:holo-ACP synthase [Candidatus Omnitrophota bacterium]